MTTGLGVKLSETPGHVTRPPLVGEHTAEVLAARGFSDEELARLREAGDWLARPSRNPTALAKARPARRARAVAARSRGGAHRSPRKMHGGEWHRL